MEDYDRDQPQTPPKQVENYSELEEQNKDRHYRCSPLVLKQPTPYSLTNLCTVNNQNNKNCHNNNNANNNNNNCCCCCNNRNDDNEQIDNNEDQILNQEQSQQDFLQSSFILDDINDKLSTTQSTPTDEQLQYNKFLNITHLNSKKDNLQINNNNDDAINENNHENKIINNSDSILDQHHHIHNHNHHNHTHNHNHILENNENEDQKQEERNKTVSLYSSDETTGSLTSLNVTCCKEQGILHCCDEFEQRIFQWVEDNVPKMVKPEEKMEVYFQKRRNTLIHSISLFNKQNNDLNLIESSPSSQLQQQQLMLGNTGGACMDMSISCSSSSSIPPPPFFEQQQQQQQIQLNLLSLDRNNSKGVSMSKIFSSPAAIDITQSPSTQSMKIIEGSGSINNNGMSNSSDKFGGSNLLKRRQSQALSHTHPARIAGNKRLSILTVTSPFSQNV